MQLNKKNSDFVLSEHLKFLVQNPQWQTDYPYLWQFIAESSDQIYSEIYERVSNLVQNVRDVDTCTLHALDSLAVEVGQENLFSYNLNYPPDLEKLMELFSVGRSVLFQQGKMLLDSSLTGIVEELSGLVDNYTVSGQPIAEVVDMSSLEDYAAYIGTTTTAMSANLTSGYIIDDSKYIDLLRTSLSSHLADKLSYLDVLTTCGIIIPAEVTSENYGETLSLALQVPYTHYLEANEYVGFIDDIWNGAEPTTPLAYNSSTSATIVSAATNTLVDICIKASYVRDTLKMVAKKYSMIGTANSIKKLIAEYIKRSLSKQVGLSAWRYSEISGYPGSITAKTSSQVLIETFCNPLSAMDGLNIDILEYFDATEYLNINTPSPTLTGVAGFTTSNVLSTWFDADGFHSTVVQIEIPTYYDTGTPSIPGGNPRYWEEAFKKSAINGNSSLTADVYKFYETLGLDYTTLSGISAWLSTTDNSFSGSFLPSVWRNYSVSGYGFPTSPDLSGLPAPRYLNVDPTLIPDDGWLIKPADLSKITAKYIGSEAGDNPPTNIKNAIFPTTTPHPFLLNLIEKTHDSVLLRSTSLMSVFPDTTGELIDAMGKIINSWKYTAHEFTGYDSAYENSINLDFNQEEDSRVDIDGIYSQGALSGFLLCTAATTGDIAWSQAMSGWYSHLKKYDDEFYTTARFSTNDSSLYKMNVYRKEITNLSGQVGWEASKIEAYLSGGCPTLTHTGYVPTAYDADVYENQYILMKQGNVRLDNPGVVWMRNRSYPLAFPAASGNFIPLANSADYTKYVYGAPCIEDTSVDGLIRYKRPGEDFYCASYDIARATLRKHDYMENGLVLSETLSGMDTVFSNCFDFFIDNADLVFIGNNSFSNSVTADCINVFTLDKKEVYPNLDGVTEEYFKPTFSTGNIPSILPISGGISGYVGNFYDNNSDLVFVTLSADFSDAFELTFSWFDRDKHEFDKSKTKKLLYTSVGTIEADNVGRPMQLAESTDMISMCYLQDTSTIAIIDVWKGDINQDKYIYNSWSI